MKGIDGKDEFHHVHGLRRVGEELRPTVTKESFRDPLTPIEQEEIREMVLRQQARLYPIPHGILPQTTVEGSAEGEESSVGEVFILTIETPSGREVVREALSVPGTVLWIRATWIIENGNVTAILDFKVIEIAKNEMVTSSGETFLSKIMLGRQTMARQQHCQRRRLSGLIPYKTDRPRTLAGTMTCQDAAQSSQITSHPKMAVAKERDMISSRVVLILFDPLESPHHLHQHLKFLLLGVTDQA